MSMSNICASLYQNFAAMSKISTPEQPLITFFSQTIIFPTHLRFCFLHLFLKFATV